MSAPRSTQTGVDNNAYAAAKSDLAIVRATLGTENLSEAARAAGSSLVTRDCHQKQAGHDGHQSIGHGYSVQKRVTYICIGVGCCLRSPATGDKGQPPLHHDSIGIAMHGREKRLTDQTRRGTSEHSDQYRDGRLEGEKWSQRVNLP